MTAGVVFKVLGSVLRVQDLRCSFGFWVLGLCFVFCVLYFVSCVLGSGIRITSSGGWSDSLDLGAHSLEGSVGMLLNSRTQHPELSWTRTVKRTPA